MEGFSFDRSLKYWRWVSCQLPFTSVIVNNASDNCSGVRSGESVDAVHPTPTKSPTHRARRDHMGLNLETPKRCPPRTLVPFRLPELLSPFRRGSRNSLESRMTIRQNFQTNLASDASPNRRHPLA